MRTRTFFVAAIAVVAAACSGSPTVATVNGEPITADDVNALSTDSSDDPIIDGGPFRADLEFLIINALLRTTAEEQFGATGLADPERLASRISDPPAEEQALFANIENNPERTRAFSEAFAELLLIRQVVGAEIAPDDVDDFARGALFTEWVVAAEEVADIDVRSQVGIWGGLGEGVLPPPP